MKVNFGLTTIIALSVLSGSALGQQSTTYQIDRSHSGESIWATPPAVPMQVKWDTKLPSGLSYPIIADGHVFVLSRSIGGEYGTILHSLDPVDGHRLWQRPIPGTYEIAGLTYGDGRVYVINFNGRLSSFDPITGVLIWSRQLQGQYAFTSPPTFSNGLVYVGGAGGGGTVYAVQASTGNTLWTQSVENGDHSAPAVSDFGVFVSYAGNQAYRFDPLSGALDWHHDTPISGGGGKTALLTKYGLYVRDFSNGNRLLNLKTGRSLLSFESDTIPAASGKYRYDLRNHVLTCVDQTTQTDVWSFTGDGTLCTAPIVVNNFVIVGGQSGQVYFLKKGTGTMAWSTNVGYPIESPNEHNAWVLSGLAAGEGLILIPAGNHLVALSN